MLSKSAATVTSGQLQTTAQNYFNGLFSRPDAQNVIINTTYTAGSGGTPSQVIVNGSASVPTDFMGIFGFNTIAVNGTATSKWGTRRLRVALVLDNTGSMAQSGKITALKTATNNLLTQLQNAVKTAGDVYVSIIPFVKDVDVGSSNYNSSWIYWGNLLQDPTQTDQTSWDANNGTCSLSGHHTRSSCTASGSCSISGHSSSSSCTSAGSCSISGHSTQSSCQSNYGCSKSQYTTQSQCTNHNGTWAAGVWTTGVWTQAVWTPDNHNTWNGCVMDRGDTSGPDTGNYDTNVVAPTSVTATLFPAEQYSYCPQAAMGLNDNWSAMTTEVNNMTPNGSTNQPIGLVWGWQTLAGGGPFTAPAFDPNYQYQQVIILLTDGLNTQDRWYGNGVNTSTQVDSRMYDQNGNGTCANIKAAGITIYTIQVDTSSDPTSTLLQNCASDSSKFFLLTSANEIVTTFNSIGTALTQLYISN